MSKSKDHQQTESLQTETSQTMRSTKLDWQTNDAHEARAASHVTTHEKSDKIFTWVQKQRILKNHRQQQKRKTFI